MNEGTLSTIQTATLNTMVLIARRELLVIFDLQQTEGCFAAKTCRKKSLSVPRQDDIIDDVGDFVAAAEILKERGAYKIYIMATHGLLSADAPRLIEESAIDEVRGSNPQRTEQQNLKVEQPLPPSGFSHEIFFFFSLEQVEQEKKKKIVWFVQMIRVQFSFCLL